MEKPAPQAPAADIGEAITEALPPEQAPDAVVSEVLSPEQIPGEVVTEMLPPEQTPGDPFDDLSLGEQTLPPDFTWQEEELDVDALRKFADDFLEEEGTGGDTAPVET